jgi:hypothetical protein
MDMSNAISIYCVILKSLLGLNYYFRVTENKLLELFERNKGYLYFYYYVCELHLHRFSFIF